MNVFTLLAKMRTWGFRPTYAHTAPQSAQAGKDIYPIVHLRSSALSPPPLLQAGAALLSTHCSNRREVGGTLGLGARQRTLTRPRPASWSVGFTCVWLRRLPDLSQPGCWPRALTDFDLNMHFGYEL